MGFHYGYEKKKFDAEWTRLEQEYRAAGMDDRQIAAMKEYGWSWSEGSKTCASVFQEIIKRFRTNNFKKDFATPQDFSSVEFFVV